LKVNNQKLFNILKKFGLHFLIKSLKKFKDHDLNNSVTKGGELAKKIVAVQGASPRVNGLQFTIYIINHGLLF